MTFTLGSPISTTLYLERVRDLAPLIEADAATAERAGRLTDAIVEALHEAGLFRMMVPEPYGGGLSMREVLPVFGEVARIDGAVGWNLCIGAISLYVVATHLRDETTRLRVIGDPNALVAGSINPSGAAAVRCDGGYRISGLVPFASGSAHATTLMAIVPVVEDGRPVAGHDGLPTLIASVMPIGAGRPLDTWHVSGLRATSSNDYVLEDVFVPDLHTFMLGQPAAAGGDALAGLPLLSQLGAGLSSVALGISTHALDLVCALAAGKVPMGGAAMLRDRTDAQITVARARAMIGAGRSYLLATWDELEAKVRSGTTATVDELAGLRLSYVAAAEHAAAATDLLYCVAGSSALFEAVGIERCWRDVHAATQHFAVSPRHLERVGRVTFGLTAGPGPI